MKKIYCLNAISSKGTALLNEEYELTENMKEAAGVLVRSASMHEMELPDDLLAVARAGAGVNNIPLDACADKGIVVFNTPGANANGVKELVIAGLMLASRDVVGGINWVKDNKEDENIAKSVERPRRHLPDARSRERNWASSDWERSVRRWPMRLHPSVWRSTDTTRLSRSMRHGCFPEM